LIAFGFSSIVLNHRIDLERHNVNKTWRQQVSVDVALEDRALAGSIRDQLGLMGHLPGWLFNRDSISFEFRVSHLGRKYELSTDLRSGWIEVAEKPQGFWSVLNGLHFLNGKIPNAPLLIKTWTIFQHLTLWVMTISVFLGIWLWWRKRSRKWSGRIFAVFIVGSIILMLLL
jgi:hypothetical protein